MIDFLPFILTGDVELTLELAQSRKTEDLESENHLASPINVNIHPDVYRFVSDYLKTNRSLPKVDEVVRTCLRMGIKPAIQIRELRKVQMVI